MSTISSVTDTSSLLASAAPQQTALGKEDFLTLLVAQLENQDPLNPADATAFTAQLAQFSQLEQLSNINTSLESFSSMSGQVEKQSALGLMGDEVVVQSSQFDASGGPQTLGYRLQSPSDKVELFVLDHTGYNVATIPGNSTTPGDHFVEWDGLADSGAPVPPGSYSLVVKAVDADDKLLDSSSLIKTQVSGVELGAAETSISTPAGTFSMAKVEAVSEPRP